MITYKPIKPNKKMIEEMKKIPDVFSKEYDDWKKNLNEKDKKRIFPNGSVRDTLGDKPMLELIPYDLFYKRVGALYTKGAKHYNSNNWRKGQPMSTTIGSLQRHLAKYMMGWTDEDHLSAVVFNALSLLNADEYFKNDPLVNDIGDWFKDGKPTGNGNYEDKEKK